MFWLGFSFTLNFNVQMWFFFRHLERHAVSPPLNQDNIAVLMEQRR